MKEPILIEHKRLHELCLTILKAGGVDDLQATSVADNLVWSELVGRENFGLLRLPIYLERVAQGGLNTPCVPKFKDVSLSAALLDADGGFGQFAAGLAMDRAIEIARINGVGSVGVRNSNFFGTGAFFVNQAAKSEMIGLVMSNSFPKVTAHNGLTPVLGTNPLAFGAPRENGESLLFDMATSALAGSTVREYIASGSSLPEGLAINSDGSAITDPAKVSGGALLPAAGAKGYGLSLLVEILAGVLTGAGVSDDVGSMYQDVTEPGQNGHFMIALDISCFMPLEVFKSRLNHLTALIKASNPQDEVLLPGEIRWRNYNRSMREGVWLSGDTLNAVESVCRKLNVSTPWTVKTAAVGA